MLGRAEEGVQRSISGMVFILVADVLSVSLGIQSCLERSAMNCTQKCRGLDYRAHTNLSPFRHDMRTKCFAVLVDSCGHVCRQPW